MFVDKKTLPNYKNQLGFLQYRRLKKETEQAWLKSRLQKTFKDDRVIELMGGARGSVDKYGNVLEKAMSQFEYQRIVDI